MRRIRLVVAYDGTAYHGWQLQKNGISVEEVLNQAITSLVGEETAVVGASRTDAGVHALGNVAVFDTSSAMAAGSFCMALNARLPEDIRVLSSEEVPADWHPRKVACRKTYEYRIENTRVASPLTRHMAYFYHYDLDEKKMQEAADFLVGEHDFASFVSSGSAAKTTVRTIYSVCVSRERDVITIRISGNGFLYNMVRIIAGTLVNVGCGKLMPQDMKKIMDARDRRAAGPTAPAKGLVLVGIDYEDSCGTGIL